MTRYVIFKDLHSFFRDFRSFMLLFLTPILITALVGSLFMSSGAKDIPVILCTENANRVYNDTLSLVNGSNVFTIYEKEGDCMTYIDSRLRAGIVRAGIIIPDIDITRGATIEIYVDNTKPIGTFLQSYFNLISRDITNRLINTFISDTLSRMEISENEIQEMESTINTFDSELLNIQSDVVSARNYMNSVDDQASIMRSNADSILIDSQNVRNNANSIQTMASRQGYADVLSTIMLIYPYISSIESSANNIKNSVMDTSVYSSNLGDIENSVVSLRGDINSLRDSVSAAKGLMLQIKNEMPEYSDPVKTEVVGYFGNKSYIHFIFPSILIMIVMWMATFLSSINFIRQKSRGILRRIYISPMSTRTIALDKILSNTIISLIPLPFILGISFFILGIELTLSSAILVFLAAAFSVVIFAITGLIIGSFSKSETTAILGSLIIIIPLMFMSGALYPVEAFPDTIKMFTEFLPINAGIRLVEGFLFYSFDLVELLFLIYTMTSYVILLSVVCWFLMRRSLRS
jgi:ABC-type multidrug transport system permease subunit